jgi:hypothetical protein
MASQSKSAAPMVTASAKKKGAMKHNFRRIEIMPAHNGYTVLHHPPTKEGKNAYTEPMEEPTQTVFGGQDAQGEMLKHIGSILGEGKAPGNKDGKSGKMDAEDKKDEGKNEKTEDEIDD